MVLGGIGVAGALAAFGYGVWPTPWSYREWDGGLVRVHRFTSRVEHLHADSGWVARGARLAAPNPFDAIADSRSRDTTSAAPSAP